MKLDMHCHTKEGSIDANISIFTYVRHLSNLGYDGMLVTDHNSYKGYEAWQAYGHTLRLSRPFTVLKGIEYDTADAGHFIVILPDHIHLRLLEIRGLPLSRLITIVHRAGGILGPAHPYGHGSLAIMHSRIGRTDMDMLHKCDFIESYNGCESLLSNERADRLTRHFHKPGIAGSDAHRICVIGTGYTIFAEDIRCNNDLIRSIMEKKHTEVPHYTIHGIYKKWNTFIQSFMNLSYLIYHRILSLAMMPARRMELQKLRNSPRHMHTTCRGMRQ